MESFPALQLSFHQHQSSPHAASPLDADRLCTILWTLYWRGTAAVRERIEDQIQPARKIEREQREAQAPDGEDVLSEVRDFVRLARSGPVRTSGARARCRRSSGPSGASRSAISSRTHCACCAPGTSRRRPDPSRSGLRPDCGRIGPPDPRQARHTPSLVAVRGRPDEPPRSPLLPCADPVLEPLQGRFRHH